MAGDWIAIRCDLANEPEVISIAAVTSLDEFAVVGRLHRLWSWANRHTAEGNAPGVTYAWVDRYLQSDGFAEAMAAAGWLQHDGISLVFPKFDRFNSQGGKKRLLTAKRVANHKRNANAGGNARSVSSALPKEQNRTEQLRGDTPHTPPAVLPALIRTGALQDAVDDWLAYKAERREAYKKTGLKNFLGQVANAVAELGEEAVISKLRRAMAQGWRGWDHHDSRGSQHPADDPRGIKAAAEAYLNS